MSDMEDDFMCDDEEDYDLVIKIIITCLTFKFTSFIRWELLPKSRQHGAS